MGRASRMKRLRRSEGVVLQFPKSLELLCSNCDDVISPNEISFSCDWDGGQLNACNECAPSLMELLDNVMEAGSTYRDGWVRHCAGEVDCFAGYTMRR